MTKTNDFLTRLEYGQPINRLFLGPLTQMPKTAPQKDGRGPNEAPIVRWKIMQVDCYVPTIALKHFLNNTFEALNNEKENLKSHLKSYLDFNIYMGHMV